jgi:hypothetical protein
MEPCVAHVDEAGARLADGRQQYTLAAVLTSPADRPGIVKLLSDLQVGEAPLHHHAERPERRVLIVEALTEAPLHGSILIATSCAASAQERARARLLSVLLPTLEHVENVQRVTIESRAGGDRHDRRTRDRLRRSHQITSALRVDHAGKSEPMLWIADFIVSAYVAANHRDQRKAWEIISGAHCVDVTVVEP